MKFKYHLASFSRKILLLILFVIGSIGALYYLWEQNKVGIVKRKIRDVLRTRTDSLYSIQYDSIFFDEIRGDAYLTNIRIKADSFKIRNSDPGKLPYLFLDITIKSISIKGVKTDKALGGHEMIGDTVMIDQPQVLVYFLKPIKKQTKIDAEAHEIYREILGRLDRIRIGKVVVRNGQVHAVNFANHYRQFDLLNATINLDDVRVDSLNNEDTSRILFCRNAAFTVDRFTSFNNNRDEFLIQDVTFMGKQKTISFSRFSLKRFENKTSQGLPFIEANDMMINGINTFEVIKNKNIYIDSIIGRHILFYRPPSVGVNSKPITKEGSRIRDTTGFRAAYSLELNNLYFPVINIIENTPVTKKERYTLGKFSVKVRGVQADRILDIQTDPLEHVREFDLQCDHIASFSDDRLYHYTLSNFRFNSKERHISIDKIKVIPMLDEATFAHDQTVQKDRYDLSLNGISINGIDPDRFLDKEVIANSVNVNSSSVRIYRDISKPLDGHSKVGKYPHQILMKAGIPIDIKKLVLNNTYLEYKEKNALTDRAGTIPFQHSRIILNNVSNLPSSIQKDGICTASFQTVVLNTLPLNAFFKFYLGSKEGKFAVDGSLGSCDATKLNQVSLPMALLQANSGNIDDAVFKFTGNDAKTNGEFVMRYHDLKVDLLKKEKSGNLVKKKKFMSFLANTMMKNDNPHNGKLRTFSVHYDRDTSKSFFNLVWKTVFTGIQATMGKPMPKIKEK